MVNETSVRARRQALLSWYDRAGRVLPWRVGPAAGERGLRADPYRVWVSEVMLQQTTVAAVIPYFERFMARFPAVDALAEASEPEVLELWAGLGYYSRGRALHRAAQALAAGGWPADEAGWRALPGVGPYTAAAVAAIALDQPANVVDGNVERVMARWHGVETPLPTAKPELRALAAHYVSPERPGDWAQALMDLGATVCTPRSPTCGACPVADGCVAQARGLAAELPRKLAKPPKPVRHGVAFVLQQPDGAVWVQRRPAKGLLAGMVGLPTTPWREGEAWGRDEAAAFAPATALWVEAGQVRHVFTHFALELSVWRADWLGPGDPAGEGFWLNDPTPLPTVFGKCWGVVVRRETFT